MKNQEGFLTILAIILIVILSIIGVTATYQLTSSTRQATNSLRSLQAFYMAQSGIEHARHAITKGIATCTGINGATGFTNATFSGAAGVFTVTTTLNGSNQCVITSIGGVPNLTNPVGKRTVQVVLPSVGVAPAPVIGGGAINLAGSAMISNPTVTSSSDDYPGSTIISSSTVGFTGNNARTTVAGSNPASNRDNENPDISENNTAYSTGTLFNKFFMQSKTMVQASAVASNGSNLDSSSFYGKTVWVTSSSQVDLNSNMTIGSSTNPVILIVNNDVRITGNVTLYGLLYVIGEFDLQGNLDIHGAAVAEGSINKISGNATITYDPTILTLLKTINPNMVLYFKSTPVSWQEIIA